MKVVVAGLLIFVAGILAGMILVIKNVGSGKWHVISDTNVETRVQYKLDFK